MSGKTPGKKRATKNDADSLGMSTNVRALPPPPPQPTAYYPHVLSSPK
jgi:hypothetical protein